VSKLVVMLRNSSMSGAVESVPPTLSATVPNWKAGDRIHLGHRTLTVVGKRDEDADQPPILVVEAEV